MVYLEAVWLFLLQHPGPSCVYHQPGLHFTLREGLGELLKGTLNLQFFCLSLLDHWHYRHAPRPSFISSLVIVAVTAAASTSSFSFSLFVIVVIP